MVRRNQSHVRRTLLNVLGAISALGVGACTPSYIVVPAAGGYVAKESYAGFAITAAPNTWSDEPSDLNEYLTPIWIQLVNRSQVDVRVVYADLSLIDATGFRYAAVSPYRRDERLSELSNRVDGIETDVSGASGRSSEWYFDSVTVDDEHARLLPTGDDGIGQFELVRHTMHGGAMHGGGMRGGAVYGGGMRGGFRHGGYYGPRGGFYGPTFGFGFGYYSPWPYFYAWPPYYGPYVYYWSNRYYPTEPPESIRQRGLPEGVLHPGGTVAGFVYFQHVEATRPTKLDLAWQVRDKDAKHVAVLHVALAVVPD